MAVLIVEDEVGIREAAAAMLRTAGYDVRESGSAEAGLRMIQREPEAYTHVLADYHLPGDMNGLQLARMVSINWPFIATSVTSGDADVRGQTLLYGMRYMPKPWAREQLLGLLAEEPVARLRIARSA